MAREKKEGYQNPVIYRFNQFADHYNHQKSLNNRPMGEKIRCGKYRYAIATLLAYWHENKAYLLEKGHQNPEFLPSLFTNNLELKERTVTENKSTSWRCIEWLCDLNCGDNIGMFMTKTFHGRKNDYQLRINPFFLCGKIILNWGEISEGRNEEQEREAQKIASQSVLIAKCSLPTIAKTDINIYKTTTTRCGKVDNMSSTQNQQQKHFAKTKGGSLEPFGENETSLSSTAKTKTGGAGVAPIFSDKSHTGQANANPALTEKGHNRTSIQDENNEKVTRLDRVNAYVDKLVSEFFVYSTQLLYPTYHFSKNETQKIQEIIRHSWYEKGIHSQTLRADLDSHQESLFELVAISLQEVQNNPQFSYIHPNAKVFFDHKFKHGLVRAYDRYRKNKLARDLRLVQTAQKSVKYFKIPRGVKTVNTLPQLVNYWVNRLDNQSFNKQSTLHTFNVFLSNPKNLYGYC